MSARPSRISLNSRVCCYVLSCVLYSVDRPRWPARVSGGFESRAPAKARSEVRREASLLRNSLSKMDILKVSVCRCLSGLSICQPRLRACSVAAQQQQLALCSMCARSVRQVERDFD